MSPEAIPTTPENTGDSNLEEVKTIVLFIFQAKDNNLTLFYNVVVYLYSVLLQTFRYLGFSLFSILVIVR